MLAVVTPGPSPLPAKVCLPFRRNHTTEFYKVQEAECWYADRNVQDEKRYTTGSPQVIVREFLETAVLETVSSIYYEAEPSTSIERPTFGCPIGHRPRILYNSLRLLLAKYREKYKNQQIVLYALDKLDLYMLAEAVVELTGIFLAGRNWNAVAGKFGAALITLAKTLWFAESSTVEDRKHKLKGVPLGGQRYGSSETKYVSYMVSVREHKSPGVVTNYLETGEDYFLPEKHGETIMKLLGCEHPPLRTPPLRPTRAHTLDFAATWEGTAVIDGECKIAASAKGPEAAVLVLHAAEQLNWADRAVSILTTSSNINFYCSEVNEVLKLVSTRVIQADVPFRLEHQKGAASQDVRCNNPPPYYLVEADGKVNTVYNSSEATKKLWEDMNIQKRTFTTQIMWALDVLVTFFESGNYISVADNANHAYWHGGLREPNFVTSAARVQIPKEMWSRFRYSPENMAENVGQAAVERAKAEVSDTLRAFTEALGDKLSPGLRGALNLATAKLDEEEDTEGEGGDEEMEGDE